MPCALAAIATIALSSVAVSAQEAAPKPAPPAEWSSQCQRRAAAMRIARWSSVWVQETGQLVIVVSVRVPHAPRTPAMLVQPLGLFLPAGIQLGVDDRDSNPPVQRCDANGCYAGLVGRRRCSSPP